MKFNQSIHARLLLWLILPLVAIATLVAIETYYHAKRTAATLHDQTLFSVMLVIAEAIVHSRGDLLPENILGALEENLGDQFFYHAVGPDNAFVTGYSGVPAYSGDRDPDSTDPLFYNSMYQGDEVRVVSIRRFVDEPELSGWMTITAWQRVAQQEILIFDLLARSVMRLVLLLICAGIIVWLAVSYGLKPLQSLKNSVERRSPDDLSFIRGPVPAEVTPLVNSMNNLFSQLSRANQVRERFLGDAAHQLRNPIAAIKTQSEAAIRNETIGDYKASIEKIGSISTMTSKLIEQLLVGAKTHAQNPKSVELFKPAAVIRNAAEEQAYMAMKNNHEYSLEITDDSVQVQGYPDLLIEAIKNLIDNAITHNPDGAQIEIGMALSRDGKFIDLYVADNGRTIETEEFGRLLEPFSTGNDNNPGTGLGLSVVNDIARLHGGELVIENRSGDNGGKAFLIHLPLKRAA